MSDRTTQIMANIAYEVSQIAADYAGLVSHLNELNPNLVSDSDVKVAKQRTHRLRSLVQTLQQQAKQG